MKRLLLSLSLLAFPFSLVSLAQSGARQFTVSLTPDAKATLAAYLPEHPTGRAVVDCPGGGYSHLSMQNEGHDWAPWVKTIADAIKKD